MKQQYISRFVLAALIMCLAAIIGPPAQADTLRIDIPDTDYTILHQDGQDAIQMAQFGIESVPGCPRLPSRIFAVAVPPDAIVDSIDFEIGSTTVLPGEYAIEPVTPPRVIGDEDAALYAADQQKFQATFEAVFSRDTLYPVSPVSLVRSAFYRKYQLVDVRVMPIQYRPKSGVLVLNRGIRIVVHYTTGPVNPHRLPLQDLSPRMEAAGAEFILNYAEAQTWYSDETPGKGGFDFVIITTPGLLNAVEPLATFELRKGRSVKVVTTDWIASNYSGVDLAQKMRVFLREKYPSDKWGIEDVLFVGHHTDVPMRMAAQNQGYGSPRTDFYFAELSKPDDESWDSNGNGSFCDDMDVIDFYAEINVGRIPWSDAATVQSICEKSVAYEMNDSDAYKQNILLLGAFFWENTDNAVLMEAKVDQPWMTDWTITRLYEDNGTVQSVYPYDFELTHTNAVDVWSSGQFAFVNWAGHGSPTSAHTMGYSSAAFIRASDCSSLNDDYPAIIFADACSNSDTDETNIGMAMLQQGAVGFVGATKVAYGSGGWQAPEDGSTQSLDYFFTISVTSTDYTQGAAHQRAMREVYQLNGWYYPKYEICEWNLWGNPDLGMAAVNLSNGQIYSDKEKYTKDQEIELSLLDADLDANPTIQDTADITVTTDNGDSEIVTMTENAVNSGIFTGTIMTRQQTVSTNNGVLDIQHGDQITALYIDADDGMGGMNVEKRCHADADLIAPQIADVSVDSVRENRFVVSWTTDEITSATVLYGTSALDTEVIGTEMSTAHEIALTDLDQCTTYYFTVQATDIAGNVTVDDNNGMYYSATTDEINIIMWEPMDTDPNWTISGGDWEFGVPTGEGGQHGFPDPTAGYTGANVYGYNLNGDYDNNMQAYTLTTPPVDCTDEFGVKLSFWRWLGVEKNQYDHASVKISRNGSDWITVWENPSEDITDNSWTFQELDISDYADDEPTVWIRWVMGATDAGWRFCGWNIDDVSIFNSRQCATAPTPTPTVPATGIELILDDAQLETGDTFNLHGFLHNSSGSEIIGDVYIVLDVYSDYWFFPSWSHVSAGIDCVADVSIQPGVSIPMDILSFTWPDVEGSVSGLYFYGALFEAGSFELIGQLDTVPWGYQ